MTIGLAAIVVALWFALIYVKINALEKKIDELMKYRYLWQRNPSGKKDGEQE